MLSAIVPAAGSSRRMQLKNKLLLPYGEKTILSHTLETILSAGIEEVIVVTGYEAEQVRDSIRHLNVRITFNPLHETGLTGSIQAGVRLAAGNGFMICLPDMVKITMEEYSLLKNAFEDRVKSHDHCICLPMFRGETGNPVVFSAWYKDSILQHAEKDGCRNIVRANPSEIHPVSMPSDHILKDIDFPDQYQALQNGH